MRSRAFSYLLPGPLVLGLLLSLPPAAGTGRAGKGFTDADFALHVKELKRSVPREGFTVLPSPPFVVIGDEPPSLVRRRANDTVAWAVRMLKEAYFEKDPDEIIDIWLFKDKESYEKNAKAIFGHSPTTPFGYYSAEHRALIMNIATGGGTLVHEIVHPFLRANFPDCPAWFSEGLASLYEQSGEKDGAICGYVNWRLPGLQEAIRAGRLPTFKALSSLSDSEFYDADRGTNYAQARYLCYYLQEKGLLKEYYREAHRSRKDGTRGYAALLKVLGRKEAEMAEFEVEWKAFVLQLRF